MKSKGYVVSLNCMLPTPQGPYADLVIEVGQEAAVIDDGSAFPKRTQRVRVGLVTVGHLAETPDDHLSRELHAVPSFTPLNKIPPVRRAIS